MLDAFCRAWRGRCAAIPRPFAGFRQRRSVMGGMAAVAALVALTLFPTAGPAGQNRNAGPDLPSCEEAVDREQERAKDFWQGATPEAARTLVNLCRKDEESGPLLPHAAVEFGARAEVIRALIGDGTDVDGRDSDGWTPLHMAARHGADPETVAVLLRSGADPNAVNHDGKMPLHLASWRGPRIDVLKALVKAGAVVDGVTSPQPYYLVDGAYYELPPGLMPFGRTPLHYAMYRDHGSAAFAEALLEAGAAADARDEDGYTPLHYAARGHLVDAVDLLIRHGADANARSGESAKYGSRAPIHESMHYGPSAAVVEALLRGGADPNARLQSGSTPLHQAAREGFVRVADALLRGGANVNAVDARNRAPLDVSIAANAPRRATAMENLLLRHGARCNRRCDGPTHRRPGSDKRK